MDDGFTTLHDVTLSDDGSGVLGNDWDDDGDPITAALDAGPSDGTLTYFNSDGSFEYVPEAGFVGTDSFTYHINDGLVDSDPATITIDVTDQQPVAVDDEFFILTDTILDDSDIGNDFDDDADALTAVLVTGPAHGTFTYFNSDGTFEYVPDADWAGIDSFTYYVNDGVENSDPATDDIKVTKIDLDAEKVEHNSANGDLDESKEETLGAFVPFNNDDDDYDGTPDVTELDPSTNLPVEIDGETDLMPIVLHSIQPVELGGQYTLAIPANVRIWQTSDRTGLVDGTTQINAAVNTTLYVEGISPGSGQIQINWTNGTNSKVNADRIKVTVFTWTGPLNVPGYALYTYTASGAAGDGLSKWLDTPVGGSWQGITYSDTEPDKIDILWGAGGAAVGKAVYQASPDDIWDFEVNVVKIEIAAPAIGNAFEAGFPNDGGTSPTQKKLVRSGSDVRPGLTWQADVTLPARTGAGVWSISRWDLFRT